MESKLIIFLKAPRLGTVKTRLAKEIGASAACAAYKKLVGLLIGNLRALPAVELRFSPDDASAEIQPWSHGGWMLHPQGPGDLGEKLKRAFAESFDTGAQRVVIIGSDCPAVTAPDIELAWESLSTNDVVLGPATDGGYWLIGLRRKTPALFDNVPWSTPTVLATTMRRIEEEHLSVKLLRELRDIDERADWERFQNEFRASNMEKETLP